MKTNRKIGLYCTKFHFTRYYFRIIFILFIFNNRNDANIKKPTRVFNYNLNVTSLCMIYSTCLKHLNI